MPVTVVIATRRRPAQLDQCLASLAACDHPQFEVIVVDNGPSEETESVVRDHDRRGLSVRFVIERRQGASRARNAGVRLVETPLVAVTDDDVTVDPQWLRALAGRFETGVACVTGLVLPAALDTDAEVLFEEWGGFSKGLESRTFDSRLPMGTVLFTPTRLACTAPATTWRS